MSDKITHVQFRVVFSVGLSVLLDYLSTSEPITTTTYAFIGGFWGSILSDLLEPPRHYTHRGFFHSVRLGCFLPLPILMSLMIAFFEPRFWFVFHGSFGYALHLIAEAMTPMKLPGMKSFRADKFKISEPKQSR